MSQPHQALHTERTTRSGSKDSGWLQREAIVDLDILRENISALARHARSSEVMAVVKADAYGHGLVPAAKALVDGGADRLGVAVIEEALALRHAGVTVPLLAWLCAPGAAYTDAVYSDVEIGVSTIWQLDELRAAADATDRMAQVHLEVDTGMWRGGATLDEWPALVSAAKSAETEETIQVVGIWSHLACADEPGHPSISEQLTTFHDAINRAYGLGLRPEVRHIANSAATLSLPESHLDLVRPGIACYGFNPINSELQEGNPTLRPAMTLTAALTQTKRAPAGARVSYGHTFEVKRATNLAIVPLGYADGISRHASSRGEVAVRGQRLPIAGRVCMDQFVVDAGPHQVAAGDQVFVFGTGQDGEPTAQDWAIWTGTIPYEVLTRVAPRVPRRHIGQRTT